MAEAAERSAPANLYGLTPRLMGANGQALGLLMAIYSITQFIFAPVWGKLSDRVGRKPVLRLGGRGVTPALLRRLPAEGIADKELSALLARERLVPIVHDTTYEALREVSPLLGSRSGLSTAEEPMTKVADKLAELVAI